MFEKPFIIAEIGSNWKITEPNKNEENWINVLDNVDMAKACGADAVKFQLFTHKELYGYDGPDDYALPREWVQDISIYCKSAGIEFMCSAFSLEGYDYVNQFVNIHKVAAPESGWDELLKKLRRFNKPILASLDIRHAFSNEIMSNEDIYWLETVSEYPANPRDYSQICNVDFIGISDHTKSFHLLEEAVNNKKIFEVHVDLGKSGERIINPDTCVSLEPYQFKEYVDRIRNPDKYNKHFDYTRKLTEKGWYRVKEDKS